VKVLPRVAGRLQRPEQLLHAPDQGLDHAEIMAYLAAAYEPFDDGVRRGRRCWRDRRQVQLATARQRLHAQ
jgi:hypothetical protein